MTTIPLIEPAKGVTEETIRRLVETFYAHVLRDDDLGPLFRRPCPTAGTSIWRSWWTSGRPSPCGQGGTRAAGGPQGHGPVGGPVRALACPVRGNRAGGLRARCGGVLHRPRAPHRRLSVDRPQHRTEGSAPARRVAGRRSRLRLGSRVLPHSTGPDAGRSPAAPRGASPPGRRWHSRHGRREWGSRTAPPGRRLRQRR